MLIYGEQYYCNHLGVFNFNWKEAWIQFFNEKSILKISRGTSSLAQPRGEG